MTSGVKQALPQVPDAEDREGKAARNRAPQGNFAETLGIGKAARQLRSGEAKADRPQVEMQPSWRGWPQSSTQRSTARTASLPGSSSLLDQGTKNETADGELPASKEISAEDSPSLLTVARHAGEPVQATAGATSPLAALASAAQAKQAGSNDAATRPLVTNCLPPSIHAMASEHDAPAASHDKPASEKGRPSAQSFVPMGTSEQAETTRFEPASKPLTAPIEQAAIDTTEAKETPPDTIAEPAKITPRVTVLAQQNIPAPMPSTAVVLVEVHRSERPARTGRNPSRYRRNSCFSDTCFGPVAQDSVAPRRARHGHGHAAFRRRATVD